LVVVERRDVTGQRVLHGDDGSLGCIGLQPATGRPDALLQDLRLARRQRAPLLRRHPGRHVDVRDLEQQREMPERRPECCGFGGDVGGGVLERIAERGLEAGR
jgi:hypothetical protein